MKKLKANGHFVKKRLCRFLVTVVVIFFWTSGPCRADALFVNDYQVDEYLLGKKEARLSVGYTRQSMFVEKTTRFTGGWMKRFFGEVKEEKVATFFLLAENQIREIDWQNNRIYVFPFDHLTTIQWIKEKKDAYQGVSEIIKDRYKVKVPQLSIQIRKDRETIQGFVCRVADAHLRLETVDRKKNATSVTLVDQTLWVSEAVPGFDDYQKFHEHLARRLGLEAERLGCFNFILRYWDGSLDPIHEQLSRVRGYPVQTRLTVRAQYTTGADTDTPKTITKQLKSEAVTLKEVNLQKIDPALYVDPENFEIIFPE